MRFTARTAMLLVTALLVALVVTGLSSAAGMAPQAAACEKYKDKGQCPRPGSPTGPGAPVTPDPPDDPTTCFGRPVDIVGTAGPDKFAGTVLSESIASLGGDDNVFGDPEVIGTFGSVDAICAGNGNDFVNGSGGNDMIDGGPGDDYIDGEAGNGRAGADTVFGGAGNDKITEHYDDSADTVDGGPGNDTCTVDSEDVVINCEIVVVL